MPSSTSSSTTSTRRPSALLMDRHQRRIDDADHAFRPPVDARLAPQLGRQAALDHARAEAAMGGRGNQWPAILFPAQAEAAVARRPAHRDRALLDGERAVLQ